MRLMLIIAASVLAAGVSGCETRNAVDGLNVAQDGLRCDFPRVGDRVHIEIRYASDGTPSAVPDACTVAPGTRITWRGPDGNPTPFALNFPGGSPAGRGERTQVSSNNTQVRQTIVIVAGEVEARYKYDISANGIVVDPAIIIER